MGFLSSCGLKEDITNPTIDSDINLRKKDAFKTKNQKDRLGIDSDLKLNSFLDPKLSNLIVPPPPPPIGNGKLVSFSITEEVSIRDVFIELSRLAEIDIQIDPDVDAKIIFKATNRPLEIIIDSLCKTANLKYSYNNGILKISRDKPYLKDYDVDILIEHELWNSIKEGIENILLTYNMQYNKNLERIHKKNLEKQTEEENRNIQNSINTNNKNAQNIENINSTNIYNNDIDVETEEFKLSINKPASLISIYADGKTQQVVKKYIERAKLNYGSQVLIEAKVVEVNLKDEFNAGINWNLSEVRNVKSMEEKTENGKTTQTLVTNEVLSTILGIGTNPTLSSGLTSLDLAKSIGSKDLNVVVSALQEFGTTRTLSSPRISTLNNQTAKLDFVTNLVYFSVEREEEEDDDGTKTYTYTSTKQEDKEGVILEIIPSINLNTKEITLTVKPELRVKSGEVSDPNPDVTNNVPVIQTRKMETSLKIKSGDVMVIGGLMNESTSNTDGGIPFLKDIPVLGWLFKYKSKSRNIVETVIFIKATIIDKNNSLLEQDRDFYNKYTNERTNYLD